MTEPNPDLDERLARLAARKAAGSKAPTGEAGATGRATAAANEPRSAASTSPKRIRRRHPAAAGRILSVGLSSSAFLSMIAAFGAQTSAAATKSASPLAATKGPPATHPAPRPKVVVKDVHHVTYVDQWGRPIAPPSLAKGLTPAPTTGPPASGAGNHPGPGGGTTATAPWSSTPSATPSVPTPGVPSSPAPGSNLPGGSAPAPVVAPAPAPVHGTPTPSPPPTSPPTTVVTIPPPPAPPACSGTQCP